MAERERTRRSRRLRLRRGEAIAAGSAIALFALLFFPWYDVTYTGGVLVLYTDLDRTAWKALEVIAPLLALVSVLAVGLVAARRLRSSWEPAIVPGAAIAVLGGVATILVVFRILFPPDSEGLVGVDFDVTPTLAAFLALAVSLGIAVGGYRTMREEGSSFAAVADALQPGRGRSASQTR